MCLKGCLTAPDTFEKRFEGNLKGSSDLLGNYLGILGGIS